MEELVKHGFLNVHLADDASNICDVLPRAQEIARVGPVQTIQSQEWRFLTKGLTEPDLLIGWNLGKLFKEGSYGKIHHAKRIVVRRRSSDGLFSTVEHPHDIVIKKTVPPPGFTVLPSEDVIAHISEALLHVLAWQTMQSTATPRSIPRPYEVFGDHCEASSGWLSMSLGMSYVNGRTLYSFLHKEWSISTKETNAKILLEVLAQLAYILWYLQRRLRLNHRDVKVNNLMVRKRIDPLKLLLAGETISTYMEVTLIDFGFACVGCPPPRQPNTVFQAGSWFPLGELCCKMGRDIAQLIFCIHCYFPLDEYLPTNIYTKVRSWLQVPCSGTVVDMLKGFHTDGRPIRSASAGSSGSSGSSGSGSSTAVPEFHTGIYEFLRRPEVDPITCAPSLIFAECSRLLTEIATAD
jgi:hypothetical protein